MQTLLQHVPCLLVCVHTAQARAEDVAKAAAEQLAAAEASLAAREAAVAASLAEREAELAAQADVLRRQARAELDAAAAKAGIELAAKDRALAAAQQELESLKAEVGARSAQVGALQQSLQELREQLEAARVAEVALRRELGHERGRAEELQVALAQQQGSAAQVCGSFRKHCLLKLAAQLAAGFAFPHVAVQLLWPFLGHLSWSALSCLCASGTVQYTHKVHRA